MKPEEVVIIREIIKESYPYVKMDNQRGDDVWYMLLKNYRFQPIHDALITHIENGNKFAPTIPELMNMYKVFDKEQAKGVVALMDADGYFDDPKDTPAEIAIWNHNNRLKKANEWSESKKMPEWFRKDYEHYHNRMFKKEIEGGQSNERIAISRSN